MNFRLFFTVLLSSLGCSNLVLAHPLGDPEFNQLEQLLINYDFVVRYELPPYENKRGLKPYGLLHTKTKTIWINPVVFDLGNAKATLIHEAVHASQTCAGNGSIALVDLEIEPPQITRPYFMRYHQYRREIEAQAYTVQAQPDSLALVTQLLNKYCSKVPEQN
ncbi:MAG: hypothetical protein QNJ18_10695 [Xenococcaceae cyanobacterium MO_167.B52]|nr:hypothetical protein [Xenococcaceae cyanobacterium MO_167.B52]